MSALLSSFHKGNVFEILADFFLGSLGISNPNRRQFDHGYDFYCFLSEILIDNEKLLRFDYPYNIQIKSSKELCVRYGKENSKDWKKEDIDWLFRHQTPFFIGFLDTEQYELKIYDTSGIWYLFAYEKLNCSQVEFTVSKVPTVGFPWINLPVNYNYMDLAQRKVPNSIKLDNWEIGKGDGYRHIIDMGNPIVTISIEDTKDNVNIAIIKRAFSSAIRLENRNIANRNIGMLFFEEIKNNITNDPSFFVGSAFNKHNKAVVDNLKNHSRNALISMLINTEEHELELQTALKSVIKFLPKASYYDQLIAQNPHLFE